MGAPAPGTNTLGKAPDELEDAALLLLPITEDETPPVDDDATPLDAPTLDATDVLDTTPDDPPDADTAPDDVPALELTTPLLPLLAPPDATDDDATTPELDAPPEPLPDVLPPELDAPDPLPPVELLLLDVELVSAGALNPQPSPQLPLQMPSSAASPSKKHPPSGATASVRTQTRHGFCPMLRCLPQDRRANASPTPATTLALSHPRVTAVVSRLL